MVFNINLPCGYSHKKLFYQEKFEVKNCINGTDVIIFDCGCSRVRGQWASSVDVGTIEMVEKKHKY